MISSVRGRIILGVALAIALMAAFLWALQQRAGYDKSKLNVIENLSGPEAAVSERSSPVAVSSPLLQTPSMSPAQSSSLLSPTPAQEPSQDADSTSVLPGYVGELRLIVPVAGVQPDKLQDTFKDARSEGRSHDAIDIPAPAGTPVLAAADGEIVKLFQSEPGGTTIYQLSKDRKLIFYYAHLQRYADALIAGKVARQGEVIGYVGDSGNAGAGNYHLHFSISIVADPKRYWEGTNINPYPLLRR